MRQARAPAHSQSSPQPPSPSEHPARLDQGQGDIGDLLLHLQQPGAPLHLLGSLSRSSVLTITWPSSATMSRVVRLARRQVLLEPNLQELQGERWRLWKTQDLAQARWPWLG